MGLAVDVPGKCLGGNEPARARRLDDAQGYGVHAQAIVTGVANEGLGIDRAGKVNMEIGAFGKLMQERIDFERSFAHGLIVGARGAGLGAVIGLDCAGSDHRLRRCACGRLGGGVEDGCYGKKGQSCGARDGFEGSVHDCLTV